MMRRHLALLALCAAAVVGCLYNAACRACEETEDILGTGDYIVSSVDFDHAGEWQWMEGARVHVDREEEIMTVRYTRDGTTYELRYDIYDPRDDE